MIWKGCFHTKKVDSILSFVIYFYYFCTESFNFLFKHLKKNIKWEFQLILGICY